jgi:hypothetical protein
LLSRLTPDCLLDLVEGGNSFQQFRGDRRWLGLVEVPNLTARMAEAGYLDDFPRA